MFNVTLLEFIKRAFVGTAVVATTATVSYHVSNAGCEFAGNGIKRLFEGKDEKAIRIATDKVNAGLAAMTLAQNQKILLENQATLEAINATNTAIAAAQAAKMAMEQAGKAQSS